MKVDRYTKVVLTVIALALSALAINYIIAPQPALGEGPYQLVYDADSTSILVIDTRSGTLYNVRAASGYVIPLDTRTGYAR